METRIVRPHFHLVPFVWANGRHQSDLPSGGRHNSGGVLMMQAISKAERSFPAPEAASRAATGSLAVSDPKVAGEATALGDGSGDESVEHYDGRLELLDWATRSVTASTRTSADQTATMPKRRTDRTADVDAEHAQA